VIAPGRIQDLVGRWWWNYDQGNFDVLSGLLASDMRFSCRTDTGTTDFEDFVRVDVTSRDAVMAWQTDHRVNSPFPLRHNGTNVHVVEPGEDRASFASYLFVTQIVEGAVSNLSSAIVNGEARIEDGELRIARLEVVLDTMHSVRFGDR
jgi:SnoaL-like domain